MLINFCDSAFSIGESEQDSSIRYLKQIKQRNTEELYGETNVIVYQICKPGNFLHYEHLGFGNEREHLRQRSDDDQLQMNQKVAELNQKGYSLRQIATELGINHTRACRILKGNNQ